VKERLLLITNVSLFAFAALALTTVQTSLWYQIFGYFPGPALWIPCLIYVALFRSTLESVLFAYVVALVLSTMTVMPEGVLMATCLALTLSTQIFKERFFWSAASYFMMVTGLASLMFHIYHWIFSFIFLDTPIHSPQISQWLIESLLTPLSAPILVPFFRWFDRLTNRELTTEISTQVS
jgi:hypothetical protein